MKLLISGLFSANFFATHLLPRFRWRYQRFLLSPFFVSWSPRFTALWNRLRTQNPKSPLEKLHYKMARDRRPLIVSFADKLEAKKYVERAIGEKWLPRVYSVADSFEKLDWSEVPEEFVLKVNHASGGVVVVSRAAPIDATLPRRYRSRWWGKALIHPESLDKEVLRKWVSVWLSRRYRWGFGDYREWAYSEITPKVFLEEYLGGSQGLASNLKLHCMKGRIALLTVTRLDGESTEETAEKFLSHEVALAAKSAGLSAKLVQQSIDHSRKVSGETDFVRVDWLVTPRGPLFGELTNYPGGGLMQSSGRELIRGEDYRKTYNEMWRVPETYDQLPKGSYPLES